MPAEKLSSVISESSFLTKAGAYAPLIILFCSVVLIGSLSRLLLVLWQLDRVSETDILSTVFLQGLRVDLILAGMAVAPLLLVLPVLGHRYSWSAWKKLTAFWAVPVCSGICTASAMALPGAKIRLAPDGLSISAGGPAGC